MPNSKKKIIALIKLIRPEVTPLAFFTVYIGALAGGSPLFSVPVFLAMFAIFFIAAASSPFNDYFDYEIDKIIHPNRALPLGLIQPKTALYMGITLFSMGIIISIFVNLQVFFFSIFGVTLIVLYEIVTKKLGLLGNFVVAFTVSISFMYGGAAVGDLLKPAFYTIVSFFILFGREILLDVRDFEGDKKTRKTLPGRIGKKNAAYIGVLCLFVSIFLFFYPGYFVFNNIWYLILIIPVLITTIYSAILPLLEVENSARTTDVLRFTMVEVIVVFILLLLI
jgi:geranylgeranylglycerol-phosphate geranylgeranyltransferase